MVTKVIPEGERRAGAAERWPSAFLPQAHGLEARTSRRSGSILELKMGPSGEAEQTSPSLMPSFPAPWDRGPQPALLGCGPLSICHSPGVNGGRREVDARPPARGVEMPAWNPL